MRRLARQDILLPPSTRDTRHARYRGHCTRLLGRHQAATEVLLSKIRRQCAGSKTNCLTIAARVTGGNITLYRRVTRTPDELAGAKVLVGVLDDLGAVTQIAQTLHRGRVHRAFNIDLHPGVESPARCVASRLRALPLVLHQQL